MSSPSPFRKLTHHSLPQTNPLLIADGPELHRSVSATRLGSLGRATESSKHSTTLSYIRLLDCTFRQQPKAGRSRRMLRNRTLPLPGHSLRPASCGSGAAEQCSVGCRAHDSGLNVNAATLRPTCPRAKLAHLRPRLINSLEATIDDVALYGEI